MSSVDGTFKSNIDAIAEQAWNKLTRIILVPAFMLVGLPALGFLGVQYLTSLQDKTQAQVNIVQMQYDQLKADITERRALYLNFQTSITLTLGEVQKTLAAMQATALAQYTETKQRIDRQDQRLDRQDDKIDNEFKHP